MNFGLIGPRYDSWLPACDNPLVLAKINFKFWAKEVRFWDPRIRISALGEIREVAYRPGAKARSRAVFASRRR